MKVTSKQISGVVMLGLVFVLASTYGLEYWQSSLRTAPWSDLTPHLLAWGTVLAYLFTASLMLGLAWLVIWWETSRWIAALYLMVGLLGLVGPAFLNAFPQDLSFSYASPLWAFIYPSTDLLTLCFSFLAVSGIAGLLVRREYRHQRS